MHRGNEAAAGVVWEPPASLKLRPASFGATVAGFRDPDPVDSSQGEGVPPLCEVMGSHTDREAFQKDQFYSR